MGSTKKWILGAALAVGALGLSAAPVQAARVHVFVGVGGPQAYIPPCPGPGYAWVAGYWNDGYWTPGYWNYVGYGPGVAIRGGFYDRGPAFYHRDFDRDRHFDRDRDRHFDRDNHFRR
ncbi:MAG: hypothetical protein ABSB50_05610 [Terracidiphilus sp.]|jgi:hypothetical protein